jgi:hypothetical protein
MSSLTPEAYAVIEGRHFDPFRYLGPYLENDSSLVRVFLPEAEGVAVVDEQGRESELQRIHESGLFEGRLGNGPRHCARATANAKSRSRIPTASRRSYPISISTCSAKARRCISTRSWAPIRWCLTAWRAWLLPSSHPQPSGSAWSATLISGRHARARQWLLGNFRARSQSRREIQKI